MSAAFAVLLAGKQMSGEKKNWTGMRMVERKISHSFTNMHLQTPLVEAREILLV